MTQYGNILVIYDEEPMTYDKVVSSPDSKRLLKAMKYKINFVY